MGSNYCSGSSDWIRDDVLRLIAAKLISPHSEEVVVTFCFLGRVISEEFETKVDVESHVGAFVPLSVDHLAAPHAVSVRGGVCCDPRAGAAAQMDAVCNGVVLDRAVANPI